MATLASSLAGTLLMACLSWVGLAVLALRSESLHLLAALHVPILSEALRVVDPGRDEWMLRILGHPTGRWRRTILSSGS